MNKYELWFVKSNITNNSKIKLIKKYITEENIYNNIDNIEKEIFLGNGEIQKLRNSKLEEVKEVLEFLNRNKIGYITINNDKYPENLKNIEEPPYVLFYKGNIDLIKRKNVAIVGARRNSVYGEIVAKKITNELSNTSCGIISGVAYGIDSITQREAIDKEIDTIGVLGCGIDIIYPKSNAELYNKIINKGLLISEFFPGTKPFHYNFPRRNRIISGLSCGVIVIEATAKSGSLITANYAINQGKDVMAVPGSILSSASEGCNFLIRDGAKIFLEDNDLYEFINEIKKENKKTSKNPLENSLKETITGEPIHLNEIIKNVNVDRMLIFELLFEMQNRNEIICLPGNYYAKIN